MHTCNWFISSSVNGVLEQVIQDMAAALRSHSKDIDLNVISAREFQHKPFTSLIKAICTKREIWHLFGKAPAWWRIVRLHSRTVHTQLEGDIWGGWPSRFFADTSKIYLRVEQNLTGSDYALGRLCGMYEARNLKG